MGNKKALASTGARAPPPRAPVCGVLATVEFVVSTVGEKVDGRAFLDRISDHGEMWRRAEKKQREDTQLSNVNIAKLVNYTATPSLPTPKELFDLLRYFLFLTLKN